MLGLPQSTEISKPLPKKAIFAKFQLKPAQRDHFDGDISRMTLVNVISQSTVPALQAGEKVTAIYVVDVALKRRDYDPKNIALLSNIIPQKMIFALRDEGKLQLAIYHTKLLCGSWMTEDEAKLTLVGTTLDAVWENCVRTIGDINVEDGNTLNEQIAIDDERTKLQRQIEILEKRCRAEKQPHRRYEMHQELMKLKERIHDE